MIQQWLDNQLRHETNLRRKEMLHKGLGHATQTFLKEIWLPAIGNLDDLHAEWEVRDLHYRCRYLDLAYRPLSSKGCVEIHGFRSHARDIEAWRFKDLCMKQALLTLDDWLFLPIAYLSIREEPELCRQLTLAFVGKCASTPIAEEIGWAGAEAMRYARHLVRPFRCEELAAHLQMSPRQTRRILERLVAKRLLAVPEGQQRYRTYHLTRVVT